MGTALLFSGVAIAGAILPSHAQSLNPEAQCYTQALSFGANRSAQNRAAYLCTGATSTAPAECYWKALSFGADDTAKRRAARLCRGATSIAPAQCYWNSLGLAASRGSKYQATSDCMAQPPLTIPIEIEDCVRTYQYRLRVSASSALDVCTQEFYRR
jgi:hypothetical protein